MPTKDKIDYWKTSDANLRQMIGERHIPDMQDAGRKEMIEALIDYDNGELVTKASFKESGVDASGKRRLPKGTVRVIFHETSNDSCPYVFAGLNGKSYYFPREEEIIIPSAVLDGPIKDAIEVKMEPTYVEGQLILKPKKIHRFPYTVVERAA